MDAVNWEYQNNTYIITLSNLKKSNYWILYFLNKFLQNNYQQQGLSIYFNEESIVLEAETKNVIKEVLKFKFQDLNFNQKVTILKYIYITLLYLKNKVEKYHDLNFYYYNVSLKKSGLFNREIYNSVEFERKMQKTANQKYIQKLYSKVI